MIDLHTHSTASDGNLSPAQLVDFAADKGISVLAITDHDTAGGLKEAAEEALKKNIVFVPGIELNIQWSTGEFHLLGLGLKQISTDLDDIINFLQEKRFERNELILEKIQDAGISMTMDELSEHFKTKAIGRPHFAQLMVEKGIVKNRQQAFDRFLAKGRPFYVERTGADLEEAVEAIKNSGGVPVLAHPLSLYVSWGKIEQTITGIKEKGIMGLEAYHPGIRVSEAQRLELLARKLNLAVTAGSDFHGEKIRADRHIGHTTGGKKIEDRFWLEELKPLLNF